MPFLPSNQHRQSDEGSFTKRQTKVKTVPLPIATTGGDDKNTNVNVYDAVVKTAAIARVQWVHLMNADRVPGGFQPTAQAIRLQC